MLTGKTAFCGETVTDTLADVIKIEPQWSELPSPTPPHIRVLLRRCLQKNPRQRLRDIGDARISLEEVLSGSPESFTAAGLIFPVGRRVLPWIVGTLAGALLSGFIVWKIVAPLPKSPMHFSAITNFAGARRSRRSLRMAGRLPSSPIATGIQHLRWPDWWRKSGAVDQRCESKSSSGLVSGWNHRRLRDPGFRIQDRLSYREQRPGKKHCVEDKVNRCDALSNVARKKKLGHV